MGAPMNSMASDPINGSNSGCAPENERAYDVGYGRPPAHSRFKPGQSGNPKGRPKGMNTVQEFRRELYLGNVTVRVGNKTKIMPRFAAIESVLLNKAFQGDMKAIRLVRDHGRELGVWNADISNNPMGLTKEQIARLSDADLDELLRILKKAHEESSAN
jgi:hypothetical protein